MPPMFPPNAGRSYAPGVNGAGPRPELVAALRPIVASVRKQMDQASKGPPLADADALSAAMMEAYASKASPGISRRDLHEQHGAGKEPESENGIFTLLQELLNEGRIRQTNTKGEPTYAAAEEAPLASPPAATPETPTSSPAADAGSGAGLAGGLAGIAAVVPALAKLASSVDWKKVGDALQAFTAPALAGAAPNVSPSPVAAVSPVSPPNPPEITPESPQDHTGTIPAPSGPQTGTAVVPSPSPAPQPATPEAPSASAGDSADVARVPVGDRQPAPGITPVASPTQPEVVGGTTPQPRGTPATVKAPETQANPAPEPTSTTATAIPPASRPKPKLEPGDTSQAEQHIRDFIAHDSAHPATKGHTNPAQREAAHMAREVEADQRLEQIRNGHTPTQVRALARKVTGKPNRSAVDALGHLKDAMVGESRKTRALPINETAAQRMERELRPGDLKRLTVPDAAPTPEYHGPGADYPEDRDRNKSDQETHLERKDRLQRREIGTPVELPGPAPSIAARTPASGTLPTPTGKPDRAAAEARAREILQLPELEPSHVNELHRHLGSLTGAQLKGLKQSLGIKGGTTVDELRKKLHEYARKKATAGFSAGVEMGGVPGGGEWKSLTAMSADGAEISRPSDNLRAVLAALVESHYEGDEETIGRLVAMLGGAVDGPAETFADDVAEKWFHPDGSAKTRATTQTMIRDTMERLNLPLREAAGLLEKAMLRNGGSHVVGGPQAFWDVVDHMEKGGGQSFAAKSGEKPTAAVDLDGTLAKYDGWKGADHFGEALPGARDFLGQLGKTHRVLIYTTRTKADAPDRPEGATPEAMGAKVADWLKANDLPFDEVYTGQGKPLAAVYVDDRAVAVPSNPGPEDYARALEAVQAAEEKSAQDKAPDLVPPAYAPAELVEAILRAKTESADEDEGEDAVDELIDQFGEPEAILDFEEDADRNPFAPGGWAFGAKFADGDHVGWTFPTSKRSGKMMAVSPEGRKYYGDTAKKIHDTHAGGNTETPHIRPHKAREAWKARGVENEARRGPAREAVAKAIADPSSLKPEDLKALRDHLHSLTRDEVRKVLDSAQGRKSGVKADLVDALLAHVQGGGKKAEKPTEKPPEPAAGGSGTKATDYEPLDSSHSWRVERPKAPEAPKAVQPKMFSADGVETFAAPPPGTHPPAGESWAWHDETHR